MFVLLQFEDGISNKPDFRVFTKDNEVDLNGVKRMRMVGIHENRQPANRAKIDMELKRMFDPAAPHDDTAKSGLCSIMIFAPGTPGHRDQGRLITLKNHVWLDVAHDVRLKIETVHIPDLLTDPRRFYTSLVPKPPDDGRCGREEIDRDAAGNFI